MSETIVPEVKLDRLQADIRRAVLKSIADNDVLELVIHVPLSATLDLNQVLNLRKHGAWMTLTSGQLALPSKSKGEALGGDTPVADGQLSIYDINADAQPDGPEPTKYSLLLLNLPTEEKQLKAAKKWLRKFTGLKAADLDVELEALAAGAGYLVIEGGNEPYVIESKLEMERLGMTVSMVAWDKKDDQADAPAESAPTETAPAAKVTLDQLTVGSQWLLKGIGTQVRIHNIQGEKVYFHSLYALYSSLPAWVFAAAVTPAEPLADLEAVDMAKWDEVPSKPVQLDPETEARLQEPWLMPVVELPLEATIVYQGKRWEIVGVSTLNGYPAAELDGTDDSGKLQQIDIPIGELAEPVALKELSPLVFHALGKASQPEATAAEEGTTETDPSESTAVSDGGEERPTRPVALDGGELATEKDDLIGRYFIGNNGVIFKVIHAVLGVIFTQDEGAAEAEADSVSELLQAIAAGRVKPANEAQRELWDKATTQDPEFEERGVGTSDEQDAA